MSAQVVPEGEIRPRVDISWLASEAAVELDALTRDPHSSLTYVHMLADELSRISIEPDQP